ncbi:MULTISPECIES: transketolase family protein [Anaerotruncus]|uniref:transketolase family protein n=1 Tax=Anaerotruncus TaxID=244127 RepID=UPI000831AA12|nr:MULTISPECIES: transketolase C-terminal domain-containing protein [Anaerotruncus]RGX55208.1 hypothetical protein DWV16_09495 [Anaerotruncus sp. AF02-27]
MPQALRDVYGESLRKYGKANEKVVVLDADLATSTKSVLFAQECPDRFFDVGIAEANMVSMAAGFASSGYIPFINTFATFVASICALSAKSLIAYSGLNVRLIGGNNGLTGGYDGATHHSFDDINVMRGIPGMLVMSPSDPVMVDWMVRTLIEDYNGPAYVSLSRSGYDPLYQPGESFTIGKAKQLRDGADLSIFAYGLSVYRAKKAAEELAAEGISARVYDMFTIKPLDCEAVLAAARETGAIVTAEEHSILGGLGTAVAETLAKNRVCVPLETVGIRDCFTESGAYEDLVREFKIDVDSIKQAARDAVSEKGR